MSKRFSSDKPFVVLYEDDHYIAFFKPAGLLTVPADRGVDQSLADMVNAQFSHRPGVPEGMKLHPCHRLDKETSGVVVFAKGHASQEALMDLFRDKKVHKKYIAFVHGRLRHAKGEIDTPIRDVKPGGGQEKKEAVTRYYLQEQRHRFAIVEVVPLTGRTNQIRIHFTELGHPLVGENKFIYRKDYNLKFKRAALHASELEFVHPVTGQPVKIVAPLSIDMKNFLERNRK
ncbi:MAG: RluA family pseudouridine synthase [Candidatus Omnitrophica bacterium]|nr:RluA family pseudouridine synthase [Candidatus Omnitrophota bacterium]